ncbi:DUF1302 domain-containing protein [Aquipseudomonas guryensis]|jgi:hypothetical protein|uniref:DUF1302 domain-containing protein n=1 Tax=Aquipseudomonas guryensis TaxID=2759165 RepID=A0A7W4DDA2_9GAMM|nr:DUF1302 domain-containing protein [Pseudomonas guryensis]MBB1520514.1 DUF1302 domain-containing protein [Pseudomonas guryensis]
MSHNKSKMALAVGIGIWGIQAHAFEIDTGPNVTTSLESVAEYTSVYRTTGPERIYSNGQNIFANNNDGSEYYDRGFVSNEFKLTSELHVRTEQDGLFVRGTAWYDTQIMDNDPSGDGFATHNTDSDERYPSDLENRAGHRSRLLDAYLYTNRYIGEMPASLRLGRQVINWGEGIYYADGINVINPVDIGRVVLPNASLKDALLPTNMISGQLGLTDALSVEAFYGLEWKGHELIPTGAFLNNQDYFGKGSNGVLVDLRNDLGDLAELVPGLNGENGIVAGARYGEEHDARDDGQFGVALRYLVEEWNNTEFSLYYLNYHSKVPFLSIQKGQSFACSNGTAGQFSGLCGFGLDSTVDGLALLDSTYYDFIYPEDIRLFGLSVSGTIGDTSVAGELAYRPNAPLEPSMIYELEQLGSGALEGNGASGGSIDLGEFGDGSANDSRSTIDLYKRHELYTGSVSAIHAFGPVLGLDDLIVLGEAAFNHVPGSLLDAVNYEYLDSFAWGYTLNVSGLIQDVRPNLDLLPGLTFRQDVSGTSPSLNENFIQGRKSATLELGGKYGQKLAGKLAYTSFWGARKDNALIDRDHVALNVTYSF